MTAIIKKELEGLFELLGISKTDTKKDVAMLLGDIEKEALFEAREGKKIEDAEKIQKLEDVDLGHVETAGSRILVRYYANHKKGYNEKQKEIFLAFLLTSKLKRALEKTT